MIVDHGARTITGLVVPWMVTGLSCGRRYRFASGALFFTTRPRLLVDHDSSARVGRLGRAWIDEVGQRAAHRVVPGRAGDDAMRLADDPEVGLSVAVDFIAADPDPAMPDVWLVTAASWLETSLTRTPAYPTTRKA
jgi:hypothetical protein